MPTQSEEDDKSEPTIAGCLLMVLSLAVIGTVAIPVVKFTRSFPSGKEITIAIACVPILAGALFYSIGAAILRIIGLSDVTKPKTESRDAFVDVDGELRRPQDRK
jgi:hypothetical protein